MRGHAKTLTMTVAATGALLSAATALAQPVDTARIEAGDPNDWLTYHRSYKGWNFSGLDQINTDNVKDLQVAWTHIPGHSTRGLQSMPLAADGVLYYTGSYSRTFALDGATGKLIWSFLPELDDATVSRQTHSPYTRGLALGEGKVFVGTVDGRLFALDAKTGKVLWDTKLIDSAKLTVGFTGAPLYAKGMVIIGAQGGEWPYKGPIFGVDAATGQKKWEFVTTSGTDEAKKTWGNDTWRVGGGGGWMPGTYDAQPNRLVGHRQSGAALRLVGRRLHEQRRSPGRQSLHDLGHRARRRYRQAQVLPPGTAARRLGLRQRGRRVRLDRPRRQTVHGAPEQERLHLRLRPRRRENRERLADRAQLQLRQGIDPKTGELIGRRDFTAGKQEGVLCPHICGGVSWNSGSYNPKTGLYYKIGNEWCMTLEVVKTTPVTEPQVQLNIGANFKIAKPPSGEIYGHLDARDPITGAKKWEVRFPEPPMASVLSTAGNLVFVPDSRGTVHAYNAQTGAELWNHSDGVGHQGGIISYSAGGKQYIAVTAGFGGMASDDCRRDLRRAVQEHASRRGHPGCLQPEVTATI